MRSVELFTGAGGLAIGTSNAGFRHEAVIEWDKNACSTMHHNRDSGTHPVCEWPIYEMNVADFDYSTIRGQIDLLAGGPPCSRFRLAESTGDRTMNAICSRRCSGPFEKPKPRAILVENVKGLLRQSFSTYFKYIRLQLEYPEIARREGESLVDHLYRLERHQNSGSRQGLLRYRVFARLLIAANYGVPQKRERVFIVWFSFRYRTGLVFSRTDPFS